jgi:hypothetical protein
VPGGWSAEHIFFVVWLAGVFLIWPPWLWFAVRSRRKRGEPIRPTCPTDALYCDRRASAEARGWIGGASNCLLVVVTDAELWIAPIFPLNLVLPYGMFGLDHRVPRRRVVRAERVKTLFGEAIALELPGAGRRNPELRIRTSDPAAFLDALRR